MRRKDHRGIFETDADLSIGKNDRNVRAATVLRLVKIHLYPGLGNPVDVLLVDSAKGGFRFFVEEDRQIFPDLRRQVRRNWHEIFCFDDLEQCLRRLPCPCGLLCGCAFDDEQWQCWNVAIFPEDRLDITPDVRGKLAIFAVQIAYLSGRKDLPR